MNRVVWFILCTVVGLELIAWGLLVPVHLSTVDARVLELAGASSPTLPQEGLKLLRQEKVGPARMVLQAAEDVGAPGRDQLALACERFEQDRPKVKRWGGSAVYLEHVFEKSSGPDSASQPIVEVLLDESARAALSEALRQTRRPGVLPILQTRELTNTVVFPPATSSSGQPLDAVICLTALLYQQDAFASPLGASIQSLVADANRGAASQPLEMVYLDLLALGKRMDWGQLVEFLRPVSDTATLQDVAALIRDHEGHLPVFYAALRFADAPSAVARYLDYYPKTGVPDLRFALRAGSGAVRDLLGRQKPIHYPRWRDKLTSFGPVRALFAPLTRVATNQPGLAFCMKYGLCLVGALLIGRAFTYLSPALVSEIVRTRPLLTGPQVVIGLCLLFLVLFFSESLVTRASPAAGLPLQVKFPVASVALRATIRHQVTAMTMDKYSVLSLLIFFVLQALIYVSCRMKLAEIKGQSMPSRLKLRLLENEEHLFDAGLYFGFVGTVISLILMSIGVIPKPSLMAAYSSTSFGIIFVSVLKIFHVRPYRRRLILDTEITEREVQPA